MAKAPPIPPDQQRDTLQGEGGTPDKAPEVVDLAQGLSPSSYPGKRGGVSP